MRNVHVVTSFLLRRDSHQERLLLLRRSDRVGSFPKRWAGVSGYLEARPEAQALTEIREETGLEGSDVVLLDRGRPVAAPDPSHDRLWVVHPFLFLVVRPARVRLDWEHTECRWVDPRGVERFHTVPDLARALARVYPPPVPPAVQDLLLEIARDRSRGAGQLAGVGAEALALAARASSASTGRAFARDFTRLARALAALRPSMTPLANVAAQAVEGLAGAADMPAGPLKEATARHAQALGRTAEEAGETIARHAAARLSGTVVTISFSSTVLAALKHSRQRLSKVIVPEGRPGLEGRRMAQGLAEAGVPVVLVSDALAPALLAEADSAVAGADTVTAAGHVVNKAGTYALALAAKHQGKPFYVLADSLKLSPGRRPPELETLPPEELWADAPAGVAALHRSFDLTPARLVTGYLTEEGLVGRGWVAKKARELRRARQRLGA